MQRRGSASVAPGEIVIKIVKGLSRSPLAVVWKGQSVVFENAVSRFPRLPSRCFDLDHLQRLSFAASHPVSDCRAQLSELAAESTFAGHWPT